MSFKETIVKNIEVKYSGAFDLKELTGVFKDFFNRHSYGMDEILHDTKIKEEGLRNTKIEWGCDKKVDDYHKNIIHIKMELDDYKFASKKGEKLVEGNLAIEFWAEIEKDYEDKWKGPIRRFSRTVYDKFVTGEKEDIIAKELKKDIAVLIDDVKTFLNVK